SSSRPVRSARTADRPSTARPGCRSATSFVDREPGVVTTTPGPAVDYLMRSAFTFTWYDGVQSNVPFFFGHTRTNLPSCTCVRTKQADVTLPPTLLLAIKPPASKLVRFFSASRKLARVMPLFPLSFTTV